METRKTGMMRPIKKTDAEWYAECERNWDKEAARLVAEGWTRHDHEGLIPATFTKPGHPTMYLGRPFGNSEWYIHTLEFAGIEEPK